MIESGENGLENWIFPVSSVDRIPGQRQNKIVEILSKIHMEFGLSPAGRERLKFGRNVGVEVQVETRPEEAFCTSGGT